MKRYIARQPILDRSQNLYGYELLFRSGLEGFFNSENPDQATCRVMVDSHLLFGMKALTSGGRAFINFTRNLLLSNIATLLPRDQAVVEVLETVVPDTPVIEACQDLKNKGYLLALDDFVLGQEDHPLIRLADIIKVDFAGTDVFARLELLETYAPRGIKMLAEKVETMEEFQHAKEMGYAYFQGYFFSKPETITRTDVPEYKLNYIRLLQALNQEEPDLAEVEAIIERESSLCYKLLRYLNSAAVSTKNEISSIRHAMRMLGIKEMRKWASLFALAAMGDDKPTELVKSAMIRAKFCESMAARTGVKSKSTDLFLMGLLSLMDAILGRRMSEILAEIPVSREIKSALLRGGRNRFRYIYELVLAYEKGSWKSIARLSRALGVRESDVTEEFVGAVQWGARVFEFGK